MSRNNAVSNGSAVSRDSVCDVMAALLRGAAAKFTDDQLETMTGVPARTIKSYRIEGKEPSLSNALSIAVVLGDHAVNAILSTIRYSASPLGQTALSEPMAALVKAMGCLSTFAQAAADNRIDHIEEPISTEAADEIIMTMIPFSSHGKK